WKPYLAPWATAVAIIVILPLLFVLVYLVYRCIASCLTSDSKPKRKIGLKNVLNALLLLLAVFVIAFAAIAAYGIIKATSSANRMGNVVESFANETDHYVQDNCAALKNMIGVETNVTSVMPRISKSFHEAVADMKHKLAVKHVPVIEKIHMTVSKIRTRQKDIGELLALLPILRTQNPGLADTIQPLVPYLEKMREFREVTPRDTYKQKVDTMFENIVAVGDRRLNEIAPQIQTKIDEKLKNQLSGVCGEADQLTQPLKELRNGYEQQVKPHIVYPYYAVLATAAVLLAVAFISFAGIGYSCIVTNRSADHEGSKCFGPKSLYNFSIGAVLLLLITVPLLTAALFAPLGVATDLVCDPWKNPEKRSDVLSVLDSLAARALKDASNSADEAVEGILAKLEYPVSKIVNECANETSLLQILKLGEVSDLLRAGQEGQSGGPLASYLDELNKTILDSWPKNAVYNQSYFEILKDMRAMAASPIPEEQVRQVWLSVCRENSAHGDTPQVRIRKFECLKFE
uniref:Transmembrane protein n=1 Tax=Bursaphelenchus xylophilus TaxID=6326 RepID=A0A1I7SH85_BURXY